jgi:HemY protein
MIRVLLFTLAVVAAAAGLAWFADRPGTVTIQWLGYQVETSAFAATLALGAVVVLLILLWTLLRYLFTRPAAIAAHVRERRKQQGYDALTRGLLAIGVGDRTQAQRYAGIAGRNLPREPLTALLRAQAAQLRGDKAAARRAFEAMLDRSETALLGLRGLFLEARRSNDNDAARALAAARLGRQRSVRHAGARRQFRGRARYPRYRPQQWPCRGRRGLAPPRRAVDGGGAGGRNRTTR